MANKPESYMGNEPYIFVSYSHADDEKVYGVIRALQAKGYRIWYDKGIPTADSFRKKIVQKLRECSFVMAFSSENFNNSEFCKKEILLSEEFRKRKIIIQLDDSREDDELLFCNVGIQRAFFDVMSIDELIEQINAAEGIDSCREKAVKRTSEEQFTEPELKGDPDRKKFFSAKIKADKGNAKAQYDLGMCYYNGKGVTKNIKKAAEWFAKSADQGNADAQFQMGICCFLGRGMKKDQATAADWYFMAAKQGHMEAKFRLGQCYYKGNGLEQSHSKAMIWLKEPAESGNPDAQFLMGQCCLSGKDVVRDREKAVYWLKLSAEQGNEYAARKLIQLGQRDLPVSYQKKGDKKIGNT